MAALRSQAAAPVGSAQWMLDESLQADNFIAQEVEEFQFSVSNDMEWLNEHMSDILNRSQLDVFETFKTPGKLRGKTPRTARRRGLENRAPLTDAFFSSTRGHLSPSRGPPSARKLAHFEVAEDRDDSHLDAPVATTRYSLGQDKENFDSGYHGVADDEMSIHSGQYFHQSSQPQTQKPRFVLSPPKQDPREASQEGPSKHPSLEATREVFVSATEAPANQYQEPDTDQEVAEDVDVEAVDQEPEEDVPPTEAVVPAGLVTRQSNQYSVSASVAAAMDDVLEQAQLTSSPRHVAEAVDASPLSDTSSVHRPVMRKKSSLTFASLPARAPLSMGPRASRTSHVDLNRTSRTSQLAHQSQTTNLTDDAPTQDLSREHTVESGPAPAAAQEHTKTSTQRLQEQMRLLGKSTAPRISKSILPALAPADMPDADLDSADEETITKASHAPQQEDEDDSWISPPPADKTPQERLTSSKSQTKTDDQIVAPQAERRRSSRNAGKAAVDPAAQYPVLSQHKPDVAAKLSKPADRKVFQVQQDPHDLMSSPSTSRHDGPLSASKAKLFSVFKSAKGMFANSASASASAQARVNTAVPSSPAPALLTSQKGAELADSNTRVPHAATAGPRSQGRPQPQAAAEVEPKAFKELPQAPRRASVRVKAAHKLPPSEDAVSGSKAPSTSARSEAVAVPDQDQEVEAKAQRANHGPEEADEEACGLPSQLQHPSQSANSQKQEELRRPGARITKEPPQKARPAPVNIRLRGFQGQGIGHFGTAGRDANTAQKEEQPPPMAPPARPTLSKKASSSSINSSVQSFKTTATSRPNLKALEVAARKKEQDEREAQRKAEQRREVERRRAAKAEEDRKAEQERKLADQRVAEQKQQALRQAAEQRKAEAIHRNEQLRVQAASATALQPPTRQVDRQTATAGQPRSELGPRSVARLTTNNDLSRPVLPHANPTKPMKRTFDADPEDERARGPPVARSGLAGMPAQKRRRTSEDSFAEVISRPTMAPPVRPSMKANSRPAPAAFAKSSSQAHQPPSMMKQAVSNQHHMQHPKTPHMNDLAKFSNAKIPFAEPSQAGPSYQQHPQTARQPQAFKTPGTANTQHKSSPQYPNGDNISLPDILTSDEEDSDEEPDFVPPDWANSPALRELLKQQQLVDPMKVFGPIANLNMEEVFKGSKEKQAKFRKRTSSANWDGPDRLTEEERRKDREARERLERAGGWTFGTTT